MQNESVSFVRPDRGLRRLLGVAGGGMAIVLGCAAGCTTFGVATEESSATPEADGATGAAEPDGGASDAASSCEGADLATDAHHCGRCGHDCLGGACSAGRCEAVTLADVEAPWYLAQDADSVYVTSVGESGRARVLAVDKRSGAVTSLTRRRGFGIVASGSDVYFCERGTPNLLRVGKRGGAPTVVSDRSACLELVSHRGELFSSLVDRGAVWNVDAGQEIVQGLSKPEGIASDGDRLFITSVESIAILDGTGSARTRVVPLPARYPRRLAVDDAHVYWVEYQAKSVFRMPKAGGAAEMFTDSPDSPVGGGIWLDGAYVYWAVNTRANGGIFRAPKSSGIVEDVVDAREGDGVVDLVMDDVAIYYTMQEAGRVMRIAKP